MEVHFPPEVETQLRQVASDTGRTAEQVVRDSIDRMLASRAEFLADVERGIEQADRGQFVDHEEVRKRIERILRR